MSDAVYEILCTPVQLNIESNFQREVKLFQNSICTSVKSVVSLAVDPNSICCIFVTQSKATSAHCECLISSLFN